MLKLMTIIGARPQFIKAATVSMAILTHNQTCPDAKRITEIIVHTGQHYDANMSEQFFRELGIPEPSYNLEIGSANHGKQTGRMVEAIEEVLLKESPDMVLVYGDTNSTLAGALAAVKLHIPVAHVEAGLRSYNRKMPEEVNRVLTDHISTILFCPTSQAVENLRKEGIVSANEHQMRDQNGKNLDQLYVYLVGDVMYDAALHFEKLAKARCSILDDLGLRGKDYILVTIHRSENTDDSSRLKVVFSALSEVSKRIKVIVPLHPRTQKCLGLSKFGNYKNSLVFIEPVGYLDMIALEKNSRLIVTDSGGVQKEAFFYKIPCVTLRSETEWIELVNLGWNKVVPPTSVERVLREIIAFLESKPPDISVSPFGDGTASIRIVKILEELNN